MKTLREILLKRHEAAAPRLDAVRQEVLKHELGAAKKPAVRTGAGWSWLQAMVWEYRGQLAALGAVWVLVALLRLSASPAVGMAAAIPRERIPSPAIILSSLRENRRQMLELLGTSAGEPQKAVAPGPRSARRFETRVS